VDFVPGDKLKISYMAKGGGSENMSRVTMLAPSQGWEGIKKFIVQRVVEAGPNPCPPIILGIGIGGNFEQAPKIAKKALLRKLDDVHPDPKVAEMEAEVLAAVNKLGIGPMGLGGSYTCLAVKIAMAPCHIASLPLAVNVQCHSARHEEVEF
jgi:fumarate hydratase subunit alpha